MDVVGLQEALRQPIEPIPANPEVAKAVEEKEKELIKKREEEIQKIQQERNAWRQQHAGDSFSE